MMSGPAFLRAGERRVRTAFPGTKEGHSQTYGAPTNLNQTTSRNGTGRRGRNVGRIGQRCANRSICSCTATGTMNFVTSSSCLKPFSP